MVDFGFWELALIALIALLVVGPKRLPHLAQTAGYWIGRIKRMAMMFKSEFAHELDDSGVKKIWKETDETVSDVHKEVKHLDPLQKAMDEQMTSGRFVTDDPEQDPPQDSHKGDGKPD